MKTRIIFLDNMRTFLIFLVVVLHAGLVYESVLENNWIVCDPDKNNSIGLIRMYLDLFAMFGIFFISGYFIPYSLKNKTTREFLKSKFRRIMVPWIIAVFTLIPVYKVIFLYSRGLPQEEWYTYFHLFQRTGEDLSFFSNNPSQNWLWFLPVLFLFQVLYLVLLKVNLLSLKISLKTGVILTISVGVLYSMIISLNGLTGWTHSALLDFQRERLLVYFMAFLLGSLCKKLKVFDSDFKNRKFYLLSNVVLTVSLGVFTAVALNHFFNLIEPGRNYYFISEISDRIAYYLTALLSMLSFLYIFIHVFRFNFNKSNIFMDELNRNSYSVYILHVIVLGLIALPLMKLSFPVYMKYLMLTTLTFIITNMIIYSYRKTIQKTINIKTVATAAIVVFIIAIAFNGIHVNAADDQYQSVESQTSVKNPEIGLHDAVIKGDLKAVEQHITTGADLNEKEPSGGSSPLISAATFGKTEIALVLIEAGADVNFRNKEGSTPLHTAAFFGRIEIVKALLAYGADKSIRNNAGSTAQDSVVIPFETVKGIYDFFGSTLGPLGLELDYERIRAARPVIAELLK